MNAVVKTQQAALPANLADIFSASTASIGDLTQGVTSGFPVISYRGKVWRIRKGGEETNYVDANGDAVQSLELVFVKSNPNPAKIFYAAAFEEGSVSAPDCWSADGVKPDNNVAAPVSKTCAACPNNVWGSKISESGKKTRACSDARRLAVVAPADLTVDGADALKYLLRIPPASLNPLKDYAEKVLKPKGIPYFAVVTRVGFDNEVAYPKLTFKATRFLNEDEARAVLEIQASEDVKRILQESTEFDGEAAAAAPAEEEIAGEMPTVLKTAPAPQATAPATPTPAAAPTAAAPRQTAAVEAELFEQPAPAPVKKPAASRKPATKPAPAATSSAPQPAAPAASSAAPAPADDFEAMLDKILG